MNMNWVGDLGRGIKRGVQKIPGALNKIGEMAHPDDADPNLMVSPGWNPNHGPLPQQMPQRPQVGPSAPIGNAEPPRLQRRDPQIQPTGDARMAEWGNDAPIQQPQRPLPIAPNPRPMLSPDMFMQAGDARPPIGGSPVVSPPPAPSPQGSRPVSYFPNTDRPTTLPSSAMPTRNMPPMTSEIPGSAPPQMPGPQPGPMDNPRNIPVPRLPGQKGDPRMLDDYGRARYEAQMAGRKGADGSISTRDAAGDFHTNKPKGIGWKGGLQNAFIGMQQAKAANPNATLFEMAGGALGGGTRGKVDPDEGRGRIFDNGQGRQMRQDQQRMEVQQRAELDQEKMRLNNEHLQAQTEAIKTGKARDKFIPVAGGGLYDAENGYFVRDPNAPGQTSTARPRRYNINGNLVDDEGKVIYEGTQKEKPRTLQEAEADRADEEGSVDQIAQDSFDDPGRQRAIMDKLPKSERALLEGAQPDFSRLPTAYQQALKDPTNADVETVTKAEVARDRIVQEHKDALASAEKKLEQIKQQEMAAIRRQVADEAKRKAAQRRTGSAKPLPRGGNSPAPLSEFNSSKFPGWKPQ